MNLLVVLVVAALSAAADDAPTRRETIPPPDHNCTIPVVGFTAFRGPELLKRGVRSVRTRAVCRVVIVVNGHEDASVDAAVEELWAEGVADATTTQTVVVTLARNRGVSASWNEVIESTPNAEYWLICNSDVAFRNGTLDDIGPELALMLSGGDGMAIFGFPTRNGIQYGQIAFALSAKKRRAVGQFD